MSKRWKVRGAIALIAVVVAAAACTALYRWASQPAEGALRTPAAQTPAVQEAPKMPVPVQTDYFAADLPVGFEIKRQTPTPEGLALLRLVAASDRQQIAITIADLPAEGLAGVGDYNLRVTDTATYKRFDPPGTPPAAVGFQAVSGAPAFVVFWPDGGHYASIALSGENGSELRDLTDSFMQLIASWQWR